MVIKSGLFIVGFRGGKFFCFYFYNDVFFVLNIILFLVDLMCCGFFIVFECVDD